MRFGRYSTYIKSQDDGTCRDSEWSWSFLREARKACSPLTAEQHHYEVLAMLLLFFFWKVSCFVTLIACPWCLSRFWATSDLGETQWVLWMLNKMANLTCVADAQCMHPALTFSCTCALSDDVPIYTALCLIWKFCCQCCCALIWHYSFSTCCNIVWGTSIRSRDNFDLSQLKFGNINPQVSNYTSTAYSLK